MKDGLDPWKPEMKFLSTFLSFGILNIFSSKHQHLILCVGLHCSSLCLGSHTKVPNPHLYILLPMSLQEIMDFLKDNTQDISPFLYEGESTCYCYWLCLIWKTEGGLQESWSFLVMKRKNSNLLMRLIERQDAQQLHLFFR